METAISGNPPAKAICPDRVGIFYDADALEKVVEFTIATEGSVDSRWLAVMSEGLGHRPICLVAFAGDQPTGILPLALISSLLFGRHLVSLPYISKAGIWAADETSANLLLDSAVRLADELRVRHLQLRHEIPIVDDRFCVGSTDKVHMRLPLPTSVDALWRSFDPKVRNQVRKAEKQGFGIQWGREELLDQFFTVFAQTMRDLGSPVFPSGFFASMLHQFGSDAELCVISDGATPIAAGVLVHSGNGTLVPSAASLRRYNPRCPNMLLYWQLLARATERGQRVFDFGRSSVDSNTYRFKWQWGAKPVPTAWQFYLRRGTAGDLRPQHGGFQLATRVWRNLPVALTRWLGPPIVCGLPI